MGKEGEGSHDLVQFRPFNGEIEPIDVEIVESEVLQGEVMLHDVLVHVSVVRQTDGAKILDLVFHPRAFLEWRKSPDSPIVDSYWEIHSMRFEADIRPRSDL